MRVVFLPLSQQPFFESIKEICKDKNVGKEGQHIAKRRSDEGRGSKQIEGSGGDVGRKGREWMQREAATNLVERTAISR